MIEIVECAYDLRGSDSEWLTRILHAVRPRLGQGMGVTGVLFEVVRGEARVEPLIDVQSVGDALPGLRELTRAFVAGLSHATVRSEYHGRDTFLAIASQAFERPAGQPFSEWPGFAVPRAMGIQDHMTLSGFDATGRGFLIGVPLPAVHPGVTAAVAALWSRVAVHILAAQRLRGVLHEDDALVDERGRVHEVRGALGDEEVAAVRDAAQRVSRARGERDDARTALDLWQGLFSGRWSIVDGFDDRGRHCLVARRNAPAGPPVPGLTPRERQIAAYVALGRSNQNIAYTLGLSEPTASAATQLLLSKLGLTCREELVAMLWSFA